MPVLLESRSSTSKLSSEVFEHDIPDHRGNRGDEEVHARKDIVQGERQTLPMNTCDSKFSHQKIGIEKKDDERNFNYCSPELVEPAVFSVLTHK